MGVTLVDSVGEMGTVDAKHCLERGNDYGAFFEYYYFLMGGRIGG